MWNLLKANSRDSVSLLTTCNMSKGLVTHNDILKIYRIIQYFKNIVKCNMVKNIFKTYKKITFLLKKIISV